ncbi:MAG: response regulator transcription factor [Acidobacteria bacterium]|nr:response regulator transcription factor [Acidobacteriota bacterium]
MDAESTVQVAVVEDDLATREGLALLLDGTPGFRAGASYESVEAALADRSSQSPDVIVLDVNLPGMSGADGVVPLRARFPRASILMFSMYDGDDEVFTALCNGATGYLLKRTSPARLLESIRDAAQGGAPMSPSVARRVLHLFRESATKRGEKPSADAPDGLTPHEVRVLRLLGDGLSYAAVGVEFGVSINTVRTYIRSIYEKLHVHSKSEAVTKALRAGII